MKMIMIVFYGKNDDEMLPIKGFQGFSQISPLSSVYCRSGGGTSHLQLFYHDEHDDNDDLDDHVEYNDNVDLDDNGDDNDDLDDHGEYNDNVDLDDNDDNHCRREYSVRPICSCFTRKKQISMMIFTGTRERH